MFQALDIDLPLLYALLLSLICTLYKVIYYGCVYRNYYLHFSLVNTWKSFLSRNLIVWKSVPGNHPTGFVFARELQYRAARNFVPKVYDVPKLPVFKLSLK